MKSKLAKQLFSLIFCLFITLHAANAENSTQEKRASLTFGVLPIISTHKLIKRFSPLSDFLSECLGVEIILETAPNYKKFMQRSNSEKRYDILFTAPHFYYLAEQQAGYKVVVRIAAPELVSIIAVNKESSINSVRELKNRTLSTTDPLALNTALTRELLFLSGLNPDKDLTLITTPTHNASLLSAYKNITDAASLMLPPYKRANKEIRSNMRIIAKTKGVPHMPISVAPWLSQKEIKNITKALLGLDSTIAGKKILKTMRWPGITKATSAEYADLDWALKYLKLD